MSERARTQAVTQMLVDPELLQRFGAPAEPRLLPEPAHEGVAWGEAALRDAAEAGNDYPIPPALHVHLAPIDRTAGIAPRHLVEELRVAAGLFDEDRRVHALDIAARDFSRADLTRLLTTLDAGFRRVEAPRREFRVHAAPANLRRTSLSLYSAMGFNHLALNGPGVDAAVARTIGIARGAGFRSVEVTLSGIPERRGWPPALLDARPDRIRTDRVPATPDPRAAEAWRLLFENLDGAGYVYLGLDTFALPSDDLLASPAELRRGPHGYVTGGDWDLLGIGPGALSVLGDGVSRSESDPARYRGLLELGRVPVWRGLRLGPDGRLRRDVLESLVTRHHLSIGTIEALNRIRFTDYFRVALQRLAPWRAAGLVDWDRETFRVTPPGLPFLAGMAAIFRDAPTSVPRPIRPARD